MKRKIPLDSPVRRQLWPINDPKERIAMENSANLIKESFIRDNMIKLNKWNLQNLVEDKYKWYKMDDVGAWIPIKINGIEEIKENEEIKKKDANAEDNDVRAKDGDFKTPRKIRRLEKEKIERDLIREKTVKAVAESKTVSTEKV